VELVDEKYEGCNNSTGLKYFFFAMDNNAFVPENIHAEFQRIIKMGGGSSSQKKGKINRDAYHMKKRAKNNF